MSPDTYPKSSVDAIPDIARILDNVNDCLTKCLEDLHSLDTRLHDALHDGDVLPDRIVLREAAKAVDLLHQIQVMLDPKTLVLADHFLGYVRSKCLLAAVQQQVPDVLHQSGPITLEQLAERTGSRSDRLAQVLRILCNEGIFRHDDDQDEGGGTYSNSAASRLLCADHPSQWHNWVRLYGNQFYDMARGIPGAVQRAATRSAAQINYDTDDTMFTYFQHRGWVPELHRTFGSGALAQMPGLVADYPWDEVAGGGSNLVMDIGGGGGGFLAGLLRNYPTMRGGIFDLPHVIEHARPFFRPGGQYADVADRVSDQDLVGGDFFKSVPECEVYTIKWCLHDWKDSQVIEILKTIHRSIIPSSRSRLVVLESILEDTHSSRLSQYGDLNMMMTIGGQERTVKEWTTLAGIAGWRIERIWDLRRAWVKAMDFRPISQDGA
ncbi:hypothetical protein PFICI_09680 [Pestalotiopsis fici W106-1]|uniref:O-methyltransferase domain-containing protein n=1 Tax=Pestalotiopsis fici (strain W106-1 / CGMCC3.15140) TaxID=1229662 RepID=W3WUR5_PESFW|nr:uncharacterized protein PFICI_09680 [Pestalotiopsis fici W106-1]ETS77618.1 hypothetical protein PFICI_09680 [Pestalotiopsis fici W106-1]